MTTEISLVRLSGRRKNSTSTPQNSVARKTVGWPSPAQDYYSGELDLNEALIPNPDSTYLMRAVGDSMAHAGISHGDELIIDRSYQAQSGDIVIALVDDEFVVRRFERELRSGILVVRLKAEHPHYADITITPEQNLIIWGVVTVCIHHL